jgi:addiction module RelE/StbE family toxin
MQIFFKKSFIKQYRRLRKSDRGKVDSALEVFENNPKDIRLYNHALVGKLEGKRSISAGFDLRIIIKVEGDYVFVTMLAVGTHSQVY